MTMKLVSAVTIIAAFAFSPVLAQQATAPKASKADVQKAVNSIKADKAKLAAYCESAKLDAQANDLATKNQNDPKLQSLGEQIAAANKKVGPDFEKLMTSEMDEASGALLDDLTKSCK